MVGGWSESTWRTTVAGETNGTVQDIYWNNTQTQRNAPGGFTQKHVQVRPVLPQRVIGNHEVILDKRELKQPEKPTTTTTREGQIINKETKINK